MCSRYGILRFRRNPLLGVSYSVPTSGTRLKTTVTILPASACWQTLPNFQIGHKFWKLEPRALAISGFVKVFPPLPADGSWTNRSRQLIRSVSGQLIEMTSVTACMADDLVVLLSAQRRPGPANTVSVQLAPRLQDAWSGTRLEGGEKNDMLQAVLKVTALNINGSHPVTTKGQLCLCVPTFL
jgi:hypothetical protein